MAICESNKNSPTVFLFHSLLSCSMAIDSYGKTDEGRTSCRGKAVSVLKGCKRLGKIGGKIVASLSPKKLPSYLEYDFSPSSSKMISCTGVVGGVYVFAFC